MADVDIQKDTFHKGIPYKMKVGDTFYRKRHRSHVHSTSLV